MPLTKEERKVYNKKYYQKHKEKICLKKKETYKAKLLRTPVELQGYASWQPPHPSDASSVLNLRSQKPRCGVTDSE